MTVEFDLDGADAPPAPRDAATVVVLRDAPDGGPPEIFFVKRNAGARFMGGAFVFPGGRLDPGDALGDVPGDLDADVCAARLGESDPARARGLHVAALRECLEESGILLATEAVDDDTRRALREALQPRQAPPIGALLHQHGVALRLSALVPIARWVTPRAETRRFDARFFVALAPEGGHDHARHDGSETVDSAWLSADEAIARALRGEIVLAPPTWRTLAELRAFRRTDEWLRRTPGPIAPVEPIVRLRGDALVVEMPEEMPPALGGAVGDLPHSFQYCDGVWVPTGGGSRA